MPQLAILTWIYTLTRISPKAENPLVEEGKWSRYDLHRVTLSPPIKFGWDWISNNRMYRGQKNTQTER